MGAEISISAPPLYAPAAFEDFTEGSEDFLSSLPGYDPSFTVIHFDEWSDYEENGWFAILRKDGELFEVSGGHSVYASPSDHDRFDLSPIMEERALERMMEWEGENGFLGRTWIRSDCLSDRAFGERDI